MKDHNNSEIFRLGFGLMRLPKLEDGSIDVEQVKTMADMFIAAGGTYFDTAFVYDNGGSEEAFRKAVAERYPRDSYTVATKLNAWHGASDEEGAKQEFFTSLERLGTGYIDFYLLHALMADSYHLYDDWGLWDFVKEQRDKGLIKHWGFSFHATPEILEELLTAHPDVDFIQLQLNYADWESESVYSRRCWEIARAHGKPIVVMEPIKGGKLANPPEPVAKIMKEAEPDASFASWALRYAASLDGVMVVLSGMSNIAQMEENLSFMKDMKLLDEKEQEVIKEAQRIIAEDLSIQCTACHYCTDGCPMQIPIPEIFEVANKHTLDHRNPRARRAYAAATEGRGKASDCVSCGQCEGACPQSLPIISLLESCRDFEK